MKTIYGFVLMLSIVVVANGFAQETHFGTGYHIFYSDQDTVPTSINFDSLPFFGEPAMITYIEGGQPPVTLMIDNATGAGHYETTYPKKFTQGMDYFGTKVLKYDSDSLIFTTMWTGNHSIEDQNVPIDDPKRWTLYYDSYFAKGWIALSTSGVSSQKVGDGRVAFFPNPTSDVLNIYSTLTKVAQVTIYDQLGRVVLLQSLSGEYLKLDVSNLADGSYTIAFETSGQRVTGRFIKY